MQLISLIRLCLSQFWLILKYNEDQGQRIAEKVLATTDWEDLAGYALFGAMPYRDYALLHYKIAKIIAYWMSSVINP